jgi:tellurite resistance protein TerC
VDRAGWWVACSGSPLDARSEELTVGVESIGSPALWVGFTAFVLAMLALDLGVFHRKAHEVRVREALIWTAAWVSLSLVFNLGVYFWFGSERALEFLSGYVIEKALSVDNIFVFIFVFSAFAVPAKLQHRVLFWGILGALALRAVFIVLGAALLERFHWAIYVFGAFLVFTGIKLLVQRGDEVHPERNPLFRLFRRFVPSVGEYRGGRFTVVEAGKRYATPLLLVLVAIEATDIVFAVDSIPAIFAVTTDPFIVYTSNIFAILGLRALYFALAGMMGKFQYLKIGLSVVLVFVGAKMLLAGLYKIPILTSLVVIVAVLAGSLAASLLRRPARPVLISDETTPGPAFRGSSRPNNRSRGAL